MSTEGGLGDPKFSIYDFSRDGVFDIATLISQRNVGMLIEGIWRYNAFGLSLGARLATSCLQAGGLAYHSTIPDPIHVPSKNAP